MYQTPMILDKFYQIELLLEKKTIIDMLYDICYDKNAGCMGVLVGLWDSCDPIICPPGNYSHWVRQKIKSELCV